MKYLARAITVSVCAAALITGGTVVGQKHFRPAGPDAFLSFQFDSTDELVAELKANPTLRKRYAKHFRVSEDEVVDFIKRSLVPYRLKDPQTVTVYGVTKTGRIYGVRTRLKKGTRVWATRSGRPILKWACANPLTNVMPGTRLASRPRLSPEKPSPRVASLPPIYEAVAPSVEEYVAGTEVAPEEELLVGIPTGLGGGGAAAFVGAPGAAESFLGAASFLGGVGVPVAVGGGGVGFSPAFLLPLAGLIGLNSGGGDTGASVLPPGGGGSVVGAVIPEPGTFGLFTIGIPLLYAAGRSRRRKERRANETGKLYAAGAGDAGAWAGWRAGDRR